MDLEFVEDTAPLTKETGEKSGALQLTEGDTVDMIAINKKVADATVHSDRLPLTASDLRRAVSNVQKQLGFKPRKDGGWSPRADAALLHLLTQAPVKRAKKVNVVAAVPREVGGPLALEVGAPEEEKQEEEKNVEKEKAEEEVEQPKDNTHHKTKKKKKKKKQKSSSSSSGSSSSSSDSSSDSSSCSSDGEQQKNEENKHEEKTKHDAGTDTEQQEESGQNSDKSLEKRYQELLEHVGEIEDSMWATQQQFEEEETETTKLRAQNAKLRADLAEKDSEVRELRAKVASLLA